MKVDDWIKYLQPECALSTGILIRDEYLVALVVVIKYSIETQPTGEDPTDEDRASLHGHAMDVDSSAEDDTNLDMNMESGADLDAAWEDSHDMRINGGILSPSFWNPFAKVPAQLSSKEEAGFILIGHPGIGKTLWLLVVLVMRLLSGLPTIY